MERIFISGLGLATSIGTNRKTFWENLTAGKCGIDTLKIHDTTDLSVTIGAEVADLDPARINVNAVSYTHLTLPTILLV